MSHISIITFDIKPGRVPDARALIRGASALDGVIAWKFVEVGVVNTLIGFVKTASGDDVAQWTRDLLANGRPDFLRGLSHNIYTGALPDDLAQSPAVLLSRGPDCQRLRPMTGDLTQAVDLSCHAGLDAALAAAVSLRETFAQDILLLIPEAL